MADLTKRFPKIQRNPKKKRARLHHLLLTSPGIEHARMDGMKINIQGTAIPFG